MSETKGNPALVVTENYKKNSITVATRPFAAMLLEHNHPQPGIMHWMWPASRAWWSGWLRRLWAELSCGRGGAMPALI